MGSVNGPFDARGGASSKVGSARGLSSSRGRFKQMCFGVVTIVDVANANGANSREFGGLIRQASTRKV